MANAIKYSVSAQTLALKSGNFWFGTDVDKGPTTTTDYWNGITPPSGGYTIYVNKLLNGPSISCANNDTELSNITQQVSGLTFSTVAQTLDWYNTQVDKMVFNFDYESIVSDGLVFNLDGGFVPSYPRVGSTWYDLSSSSNNGTLTNGPSWVDTSGGQFTFDGIDDFMDLTTIINFNDATAFSAEIVINIPTFTQNLSRVHWLSGVGGNSMMIIRSTQFLMFNEAGGANSASVSYNFSTNISYHVTVTRNTSNLVTLYVNGVSIGTASRSGQFRWTTFGRLGSDTSFCSNFKVYKSAIYSKELSATEVSKNYNAVKTRLGL